MILSKIKRKSNFDGKILICKHFKGLSMKIFFEYSYLNNLYFRQMVPRIALETLRQVVGDPSDVELVFTILERLAEDLGKRP